MLQGRTSKHCSLGNAADEEGVNVNGQLPKQGQHLQCYAQLILVRGLGFADPLAQDLQAGVAVSEDSEGFAMTQLQDLQAEDEVWSKCKGMKSCCAKPHPVSKEMKKPAMVGKKIREWSCCHMGMG